MSNTSDLKKVVADLIKAATKQGWDVSRDSSGHWVFKSPDGKSIVRMPGTPSDHRGIKNQIAKLRRGGFVWKGR